METTSLGSFFLIDVLLFPDAADRTAKSNANVERHYTPSSEDESDAYTADESFLATTARG